MLKANKKLLLSAGILILIIIVWGGYRALGYRLTLKGFIKAGIVEITLPSNDLKLFFDNKREFGEFTKGAVHKVEKVFPGEHNILISKEGYWPWEKTFTTVSGENTSIKPIIVRTTPKGTAFPEKDTKYKEIKKEIEENVSPTKESPIVSEDGTMSIWIEENLLKMKEVGSQNTDDTCGVIKPEDIVCKGEVVVFTANEKIRSVSFYKDRNDIAIISNGNGIFTLELDPINSQNFQPIYKGNLPSFVLPKDDTNTLHILDDVFAFVVEI